MIYHIIYICLLIGTVYGSSGDVSPFFQKCTERCMILNCTEDGYYYLNEELSQVASLNLFQWDCESECKYECMWKTTDAYEKRNWRVPQFYGKWPFVRLFGIQEPASVLFSLMNFYGHYVGFKRFKNNVRPDSPCYWLWHAFAAVCMNTWVWSTIFHARDVPITEFMDYTCAFAVLVMTCYCMIKRIFLGLPKFVNIVITSFFAAFFLNHAVYLSYRKVDYSYNMKLNAFVGSTTVLVWFFWSLANRKQQPYMWKAAAFFSLSGLSTVLEIFDFPPFLWTFDSHALWHLSTSLICPLFYSFITDDCKYLREQEVKNKDKTV